VIVKFREYVKMDIYDRWLGIKQKHCLEKHTGESLWDAQGDLSCEICYGVASGNT
jgi:hypothetical protein